MISGRIWNMIIVENYKFSRTKLLRTPLTSCDVHCCVSLKRRCFYSQPFRHPATRKEMTEAFFLQLPDMNLWGRQVVGARWHGCMEWRGVEDKRPPGGERLLGQTIAAISAPCKVCMNLNHGCANSMTIAVSGRARSSGCSAWALITDLLAAAPVPLDTPWALQIQPGAHNNHRGCDVLMQIGKCWTSFSKYVVY